MKKSFYVFSVLVSAWIIAASAYGNEMKHHDENMTPENRAKMAIVHEKMAACLRSTKSMSDCHKEMMENCEEQMGKDGCKMMGKHDHKKMTH